MKLFIGKVVFHQNIGGSMTYGMTVTKKEPKYMMHV